MYIYPPCGENFHRGDFMKNKIISTAVCGILAGAIAGLFGAGGGMVLVPLLTWLTDIKDDAIFPASVSIILPICLVTIAFSFRAEHVDWSIAVPCLSGSILGGIASGLWGKKIPTTWLHRSLGILILWGGIQYLC